MSAKEELAALIESMTAEELQYLATHWLSLLKDCQKYNREAK